MFILKSKGNGNELSSFQSSKSRKSIHLPRRHRFKRIVIKVVVEWDSIKKFGLNRDEAKSKTNSDFAVSINVNS